MMARNLKFVQQKCPSSCGIACVSMVTGIDYYRILGWNGRPGVSLENLINLLDKAGVEHYRSEYNNLFTNSVQIVSVPSLNIKAGMHYIVIDTREENLPGKAGQWGVIYDPVKGREGKEHYTLEMLAGWGVVVGVSL